MIKAKYRHLMQNPVITEPKSGYILRLENSEYLARECKLHKPAPLVEADHCVQCGYCCLRRPCIPLPIEVQEIAAFLNMTPRELILKHTVIDYDIGCSYFPIWYNEAQTDIIGQVLPDYRSYDRGYCHFFNRKTHGCKIHPVRPITAKETCCWIEDKPTDIFVDARYLWNTETLLSMCPELELERK